MKKWLVIIAIVFVLGSLLIPTISYAVPNKEPIDKVVFVHYPKHTSDDPAKPGVGNNTGGVLDSSYKYTGIHWANPGSIAYYINPNGSGVGGLTAIGAAMATWDNADGPLGYAYQGSTGRNAGVQDNTNVISWADISSQYPNAIADQNE
jgi:hypothetical protein